MQPLLSENVQYLTSCDLTYYSFHHFQHEVDLSRKECPFVIKPKIQRPSATVESEDMDTDMDSEFY